MTKPSTAPFAFISYAPADNSQGFVDTLAHVLAMELRARTGQPVDLYHDKQTPLERGDERERALNEATFLIPILSPSYLQSEVGRRDLEQFLKRADEQRSSLIFPVYYIDTPQLSSRTSAQPRDTLAEIVGKRQWIDWRELRFAYWNSPSVLRAVAKLADSMLSAAERLRPAPAASAREFWNIDKLRLSNFRCFDELELDFRRKSTLDGEWTCLAGINGAGKSSILQGLCIAMLGERAGDLGGGLLGRMRRAGMLDSVRTEIELTLSRGNEKLTRSVQIDEGGFLRTNSTNLAENNVVVGYGATRNLGAEQDSPFKNMSRAAQRMIGLFYPLAQLARAEVLLSDRRRGHALASLFTKLVREIFDRDVAVVQSPFSFNPANTIDEGDPGPLRFEVVGKDRVDAMDLPDGFRSSAAWLADLCAAWHEQQPDPSVEADPKSIEAIVLIDEIDLHLHPTLQRTLVPRLRKALPKVQWMVTTHSPLVLANFDVNEIIALDRNEEGHIRQLDRQIMGFSTDQIYDWLMGTRPTGVAIEEITQKADQGKADRDRLAALMRTSPDVSEEKALKQVSEFNEILKSFKR